LIDAQLEMFGDVVENSVQRSDSNRAVPRNSDMMLAMQPRRKLHMAAFLPDNFVTEAAEELNKLVARKTSGRFQVVIS